MKICATKSVETRDLASRILKHCLVTLASICLCLESYTARGGDGFVKPIPNENHPAPAAATGNYSISMEDGTVLVGLIESKGVKFNTSYAAVDVSLGDIVSFSGGFLTLADGSKLKGTFAAGYLALKSTGGKLNLEFESITSIARPTAPTSRASSLAVPTPPATQQTTAPSLPVPDYYGLYAVTDRGLTEMRDDGSTMLVSPGVQFHCYRKDISAVENLDLYRLRPTQASTATGVAAMQEALRDDSDSKIGVSRYSEKLALRQKPVPGQPEMVLLVPASQLSAGSYQLGVRYGSWYHFTVGGSENSPTESPRADAGRPPVSPPSGLGGAHRDRLYHGEVVDVSTAADLYEKAALAEANAFNNHAREFPFSYDKVWDAIVGLLRDQKETILKSNKDTGVLETKMTTRGAMGFVYWEKLSLILEKSGEASTKVSFKLYRFDQVNDYQKGVGHLIPVSKAKVDPKSEAFLDKFSKRLQRRE